mmetsp:Transcript_26565/g.82676  ORF Transcript_26565/g.82676 Transcript_26565/m.82676 type:complete len:302 (-) Transcript_26565:538-1443(-)
MRHGPPNVRGALCQGPQPAATQTGCCLPWPRPLRPLHAAPAVAVALPRDARAPPPLVDGTPAAARGALGHLLPLLHADGVCAALPVPRHAVCDVVLASDRPLLPHEIAEAGHLRHDREGSARCRQGWRPLPWPGCLKQGAVDQPRRRGHREDAPARLQRQGRAREHPHSGRRLPGSPPQHAAQRRGLHDRQHLEDRPCPLPAPRPEGQHCADAEQLRAPLRGDPRRSWPFRWQAQAGAQLRGERWVPDLGPRQADVRGRGPPAHPPRQRHRGLRGSARARAHRAEVLLHQRGSSVLRLQRL